MNKKKILIFIILNLVTIPICLYISTIIHLTLVQKFTTISDINFYTVINSIFTNVNHFKLYILLQFLFALFFILITFIQKDNIYASELNEITNTIKTPFVVGQGQYGTSRWLKMKEFDKVFKKNTLVFNKPPNEQKFSSAGLVVGYNKLKNGNEEIYCVNNNTHSLTVGATRSGKTRTIVLETIATLGLAGESMVISDPKGEIFHYTSKFLEDLGYEVIVIDFKNPTKSNKYNFLSPIIEAVNNEDYRKAEEYAWDITASMVGSEESKTEKIWKDGEMSIIARQHNGRCVRE